ncbi:ADP-ribosylglycohydrolase family protein [Paenibacillus sp. CF384]|uniref:ADP-ribosylglycohydrolase family protein n=1 Tax=Paenibacillus sp. CF384 TaxID=1884382 RepID=UPI0008984232|nr:ADP-ribosylglycohydrolase family protein [Paenibacillus sp. CF384]SDX09140.1 ADP-ribosylglycohydrolase [Paenibacillus sp. CF384]
MMGISERSALVNHTIPEDYMERVYAGWVGKTIGVRHGGNVEGWSYEQLERTFGEITGYLHEFKNFAADDDTNGPLFFLRALEDYTHTPDITEEQMGLTWLNYAPDGHGFYWWGGYGKSTEHTAYLNLKNGIMAPRSGSIALNGSAVAEQIGGQIFIDAWGLIAPGNPKLAAHYAEKIASVSHDGNGKYGGMFIAACIAAAFVERDIEAIIAAGLAVIPEDCEYTRMTKDVIEFYRGNPDNWRDCFKFVFDNYGYDRYPGVCHIIPNSAVIVLSLLYSEGDYSKAINICNMCGWDTDCNVGNVGTIMGVMVGLEGIDPSWRKPINDFLCCSSVIGSLNAVDLPWCAQYVAELGYRIAGTEPSDKWKPILSGAQSQFHFEFPGSTHAFKTDWDDRSHHVTSFVENTTEAAASGERSLKVVFDRSHGGQGYRAYRQTYYRPEDFNDSRYDPCFSPNLYPGQSIEAKVMLPLSEKRPIQVRLYVRDRNADVRHYGEKITLAPGEWTKLAYSIPAMENVCLLEAGIEWIPEGGWGPLIAYVDDMQFAGKPDYAIDFAQERLEKWNGIHIEVSQLTYLRGLWTLDEGKLCGSYYGESAESYTGDLQWKDYRFAASVIPQSGSEHRVLFRVQGGIRSYAAGFSEGGKFRLYKNENGYRELASVDFEWAYGQEYDVAISTIGGDFEVSVNGDTVIRYKDEAAPYLNGMVGFANDQGSRTQYSTYAVKGI